MQMTHDPCELTIITGHAWVKWAYYSNLAGDRDEGSTGSGDEWLKDCWLRNGMKRTYGQKLLVFAGKSICDGWQQPVKCFP
ncbi:hypothetical protein Tco_0615693 [Tanacetum coccineum]